MKKEYILEIFKILEKIYNKKDELIELQYINNYTLLVSVILSAQATDTGVNKATKDLFKKVTTPEEMLELGEEKLKEYIKTINYYPTKARHIIAMSKKLVENFNSKVPNNMEDLITLDGVGRKTANVVLNIAFNKPSIAVDTHVFRVTNRLGIVNTKNVFDTEKQLFKIIPEKYVKYVNHYLVLFGRYNCKAKNPQCLGCVLQKYCSFFKGKK